MSGIFDTLLLLALPGSGKSEVRNFLTQRDPAAFHMGDTVQLDDFPYVHLQLVVDEALVALGHDRVFHEVDPGGQRSGPFAEAGEWGGLCELLKEDYAQLRRGVCERPPAGEHGAARRLLERFDAASERSGARPKFRSMSPDLVAQIAAALDKEAREHQAAWEAAFPSSLAGRTIVMEFARGGPAGALPFPAGYGYAGSLPHLGGELLERACILYIWVTPEESRRKNRARATPDGHGSILFHGTPESVMFREYGACDLHFLAERSDRPGTLRVEADGRAWHVPVAVLDNRTDLTTFARKPESEWTEAESNALHGALKAACDSLWSSWQATR